MINILEEERSSVKIENKSPLSEKSDFDIVSEKFSKEISGDLNEDRISIKKEPEKDIPDNNLSLNIDDFLSAGLTLKGAKEIDEKLTKQPDISKIEKELSDTEKLDENIKPEEMKTTSLSDLLDKFDDKTEEINETKIENEPKIKPEVKNIEKAGTKKPAKKVKDIDKNTEKLVPEIDKERVIEKMTLAGLLSELDRELETETIQENSLELNTLKEERFQKETALNEERFIKETNLELNNKKEQDLNNKIERNDNDLLLSEKDRLYKHSNFLGKSNEPLVILNGTESLIIENSSRAVVTLVQPGERTIAELATLEPAILGLIDKKFFKKLTPKEKDILKELNRLYAKGQISIEKIKKWILKIKNKKK